MPKTNGAVEPTLEEKVDELYDLMQTIAEQQEIIIERLNNLGVDNDGFRTFGLDDN